MSPFDPGFGEPGGASLALGCALVLAFLAPMWVVPPLMAKASHWTGPRAWLRVLVAAYAMATLYLGMRGWAHVYHRLIGPGRPAEQNVIYGLGLGHLLLLVVAIGWMQGWRRSPRVPRSGKSGSLGTRPRDMKDS